MHKRRSKKILIYIFLFLIFGTLNNKNLNFTKIAKIDKIIITGLDEKSNFELENNLNVLKLNNLFFINKSKISEIIDSNSLVEKYLVFKKYPSTLNIKIDKTKILAQLKKDGESFFLGSNSKLIKKKSIRYEVPFIFGDFENESFFKLKNAIDESNFDYSQIDKLFIFKSGRWDIETNNGLLIKLPKNEIKESLVLIDSIISEYKNYKIYKIDLRQYNQIVINFIIL